MNDLAARYSVLIEWSDTDGAYIATMEELNGVQTHGATRAEALANAEEVIALYLDGEEAPPVPRQFDRHYAAEGLPVALTD